MHCECPALLPYWRHCVTVQEMWQEEANPSLFCLSATVLFHSNSHVALRALLGWDTAVTRLAWWGGGNRVWPGIPWIVCLYLAVCPGLLPYMWRPTFVWTGSKRRPELKWVVAPMVTNAASSVLLLVQSEFSELIPAPVIWVFSGPMKHIALSTALLYHIPKCLTTAYSRTT
jgi:hypothetical protein